MMKFIGIRDALNNLLKNNAASLYRVIDYWPTSEEMKNSSGNNRFVAIRASNGEFPTDSSSLSSGPIDHEFNCDIVLVAASPTLGDKTVLENPSSTPAERIAAINGISKADLEADRLADELLSIIWDILMDSRNRDLGYTEFLGRRFVMNWRKLDPVNDGEYTSVQIIMTLQIFIDEEASGDPGLPGVGGIQVDLQDINGDTTQKTVVET